MTDNFFDLIGSTTATGILLERQVIQLIRTSESNQSVGEDKASSEIFLNLNSKA